MAYSESLTFVVPFDAIHNLSDRVPADAKAQHEPQSSWSLTGPMQFFHSFLSRASKLKGKDHILIPGFDVL